MDKSGKEKVGAAGHATEQAVRPEDTTAVSKGASARPEAAVFQAMPCMASITQMTAFLEGQLQEMEQSEQRRNKLMIAADEIYSNIIHYSGAAHVWLRCTEDGQSLSLVFRDDGKPYDPLQADAPAIGTAADEDSIGGFGIFMVRKMMDRVEYRHEDGCNVLTLTLARTKQG